MNVNSIVRLSSVSSVMLRVALLVSVACLIGCGGPSKGKIKGKVTYDGKPVDGGQITFNPPEGEAPRTVDIGSDGTYEVEAVVGKNTLNYTAPEPKLPPGVKEEDITEETPVTRSPFEGLSPKPSEIEIKSGDQEVNIELVNS